jgi:hypothetical protein
MDTNEEAVKQLIADREASQAEAARLASELTAVRSDFDSYREKADKAIETLGGAFLKAVGKDGIKVEWPLFTLDPAVIQQAAQTAQAAPQNEIEVNLIVNGAAVVHPFYSPDPLPEDE